MTGRSLLAALAATALGVAVVACAGARQSKTSASGMDAQPGAAPFTTQAQDISMYEQEIRSWRVEMGLSPSPLDSNVVQFKRQPLLHSGAMICTGDERPQEGKCGEVCSLAKHICENAEDICRIASDMPGNTWAEDKCHKAKASCKEAEEKCCGCDESALGGGGDDDSDPEASSRLWD